MGHRQQFWTLETEEEVLNLARQHYPNIRTQRWVVWEWKRRRAGTYELALQPRQPRQQRRGRGGHPTREQQVINNFLMTTPLEEIIRMRDAITIQTEEVEEGEKTQTEEVEVVCQQQPRPVYEEVVKTTNHTDISCIRCHRVMDDDDLYDCSHCKSGVCFDCFTILFTENLNEEEDDVHIECLSCHQSTTYSNDYLD